MKEGRSSEGNKGRRRGGEAVGRRRRRRRRQRGGRRGGGGEEKEGRRKKRRRKRRRRKRSLRTGVEWTTASSRAGLNASGRWWPRGRRRKTSQPRSGVISFRARSVLVAGELEGEVAQVDFRRLWEWVTSFKTF